MSSMVFYQHKLVSGLVCNERVKCHVEKIHRAGRDAYVDYWVGVAQVNGAWVGVLQKTPHGAPPRASVQWEACGIFDALGVWQPDILDLPQMTLQPEAV